MALNLQKGQKIDLTKGSAGLGELMIGLGWDPIDQPSGGFFKGIFGGKKMDIDCDASALLLNEQGKITRKEDLVYFGNLESACRSVRHMGDNLTGCGDGDDEQVMIQLERVPANIHRIVFVVNIYECQARKQDFGMIKNAFIRVVNKADGQELARYNLSDNYAGKTALIVGEVYRYKGEWKFAALGDGTNDTSLGDLVQKYCG